MQRQSGLIEPSFNGRNLLLEQEVRESYGSGKDVMVVSRGVYQWRKNVPPAFDSGGFTFTACNGTTTLVTPAYGGTLSLFGNPAVLAWCPL